MLHALAELRDTELMLSKARANIGHEGGPDKFKPKVGDGMSKSIPVFVPATTRGSCDVEVGSHTSLVECHRRSKRGRQ